MGEHDYTGPAVVEAKVWASTIAAGAAAGGVTILNAVQENPSLLGALPTWAQSLLLLLVPPLITFGSGYFKTSNRV
jgi:hypothetical protein